MTNINQNPKQVVLVDPRLNALRGKNNSTFLLKALKLSASPDKMKQLMGVKAVAEVFSTLDKISIRKALHQSLHAFDLDFNYVAKNLKDLGDHANDKVRLGVMQTLLKTMGMDKYDTPDSGGGGDWEEVLMRKIEEGKQGAIDLPASDVSFPEYEVFEPTMPEDVAAIKKHEDDIGEELYGKKV
jgi:hypothetical protein